MTPFSLTAEEEDQLEAFLRSLRGWEPPLLDDHGCFDAIETMRTDIPHLDFFKPVHRDALIDALVKMAAA